MQTILRSRIREAGGGGNARLLVLVGCVMLLSAGALAALSFDLAPLLGGMRPGA